MYEQEATKVENLIDINGKNAHHIQDLYSELKKKDANIDKLIARLNDKREEVFKLQNIIKRTCVSIIFQKVWTINGRLEGSIKGSI
jgi:hypothetical protein